MARYWNRYVAEGGLLVCDSPLGRFLLANPPIVWFPDGYLPHEYKAPVSISNDVDYELHPAGFIYRENHFSYHETAPKLTSHQDHINSKRAKCNCPPRKPGDLRCKCLNHIKYKSWTDGKDIPLINRDVSLCSSPSAPTQSETQLFDSCFLGTIQQEVWQVLANDAYVGRVRCCTSTEFCGCIVLTFFLYIYPIFPSQKVMLLWSRMSTKVFEETAIFSAWCLQDLNSYVGVESSRYDSSSIVLVL